MPEDEEELIKWIDTNISARLPEDESSQLYMLVKKHMVHTCYSQNTHVNGCLNAAGVCRFGYTHTIKQNKTTFDSKGFPQYCRPSDKDSNIVPHVPSLLEDWDGHCNVEFSGSTFMVVYLYKYLFKGPKRVSLFMLSLCLFYDIY